MIRKSALLKGEIFIYQPVHRVAKEQARAFCGLDRIFIVQNNCPANGFTLDDVIDYAWGLANTRRRNSTVNRLTDAGEIALNRVVARGLVISGIVKSK